MTISRLLLLDDAPVPWRQFWRGPWFESDAGNTTVKAGSYIEYAVVA